MVNTSLILICLAVGIVFGIIGGALLIVIKVILSQKKAIKDFKNGKMMEIKNNPKEKVEEKPVPKPNKNGKRKRKNNRKN